VTKTIVSLDDKYRQTEGRVFLSSIQALVRLPLDQARRDRAAGLNTGGFISGYRGSPIGTLDAALWGAQRPLDEHDIRFLPGLNEELAATAVRGTQQLAWFGRSRVDGVFSLWYGKGLGADRAAEALKLGNLEGAAERGGVLLTVGDDHGGKSSVSSHQSEQVLIAGMMPILYPAGTAEILQLGLFGWALSRFSGLYVALKCVTDTLDLTAAVALPEDHASYVVPRDLSLPAGGLNLRRSMTQLYQEDLVVNHRLPAAQAFASANGIDRVVWDTQRPVLTIVAAGKAYLDTRQALADLGLDAAKCHSIGVRLYKPALVWPLEPDGARRAAAGAAELLVVEEKRQVLQDQLAAILYGAPDAPRLVGKRDPEGEVLLPNTGELNPSLVRAALIRRLRALGLADVDVEARHARFAELAQRSAALGGASVSRPPFFCSGCPHSTGTRVPEGSQAMGATGCHALPAYLPGSTLMRPMSMGAEGLPWLGVERWTEVAHVFQNMGDGTYAHSGLLAIRAAVAAGVRMTYKILYNDAVAMTGGQPVEGAPSPYSIAAQLLAEGVKPVAVIYDPAEAFDPSKLPPGVRSYERSQLDRVQRELRDGRGVSAIVYVQTCAAEKRRRRKRGTFPDPGRRVFINSAVCEGCGDCSVQSNCISIQPLETKLGRKRSIDQSSCNKDFSCLKGFCPSFVTVEGAQVARKPSSMTDSLLSAVASLPTPARAQLGARSYNILVTGIGGTGVLTLGAILGMAAHIEGRGCSVMDMTGMAQKGGAVTSHIRIAADPEQIFNARFDLGMSDVLIGCDLVVAAGAEVLKTVKPGETRAVLNLDIAATGDFTRNRDLELAPEKLVVLVGRVLGDMKPMTVRATKLATDLTGDSIGTNLLMLGYAAQSGLLPLSIETIESAIRLNGVAVEGNLRAFALGRLAAAEPARLSSQDGQRGTSTDESFDAFVQGRAQLLTDYQDVAYANRYRSFIDDVRARLPSREFAGRDAFLRVVATTHSKLMSYKDEYEVARLYTDPAFSSELHAQFTGKLKLRFHLAPPLLARRDPSTGRPRKITVGPWMMHVFGALRRLRFLRGTKLDPFGYLRERRLERRLIEDYRSLILSMAAQVHEDNCEAAIAVAAAASEIRGYGPVKEAAINAYEERLPTLMEALNGATASNAPIRRPALQTA